MPAAPPVVITAFSGEQPRIIPRLMPETSAQAAYDVRLDDGGLTPMRDSVLTATVAGSGNWKTIYFYQGSWIGWDNVVHAVPGPVADDRLYYTGDGKPKLRVGTSIYDLAIAVPAVALTAALGGTATGTEIQTRVYSYTYVTALGEESEPAPLSTGVDWKAGNTVTLSGFVAAPTLAAPRGPYTQRIYRSQTGSIGTGLYFIAERANVATNFTDNLPENAIAEPCPSISFNNPPDDLEGLISLPNGMMAAFGGSIPGNPEKKAVYFSEPWKPHAWPEKYILTVEHNIMGLGATSIAILVITDQHPYLVSGTLPENMTAQKTEQNLPCINKRSIVDLGYSIAYGSNEGLVVAQASGGIGLATSNIFNRDGWLELKPDTMIGCQLNGRYVSFYDTVLPDGSSSRGALLLDLSGQTFLTRTDLYAEAAFYDVGKSTLFYAPMASTQIRQMDAPAALRKHLYWKSKEFVLPYPENYGAFIVDSVDTITKADTDAMQAAFDVVYAANYALLAAGSIGGDVDATLLGVYPVNGDSLQDMPRATGKTMTVGIYADKKLVGFAGVTNKPVRLPSGFKARTWEVDIFTDARIYRMTLAKNMDDLKRTP